MMVWIINQLINENSLYLQAILYVKNYYSFLTFLTEPLIASINARKLLPTLLL